MDEIKLQPGDLHDLYGDVFFIVPEDGEAPVVSEPVGRVEEVEQKNAEQPEAATETQPEQPSEPAASPEAPTGAIQWRPKPDSRVLFILHQNEIRDKELGELLKKIVASIEIPFESAGFGIVKAAPNQADFEALPNPFGIVFDPELNWSGENPIQLSEGRELFFASKLADLKDDRDLKMVLWNHLKTVKSRL